jgi:hypothetical protein
MARRGLYKIEHCQSFPSRLYLWWFPTLFNFIQTNFRNWPHVEQHWAMHRPLTNVIRCQAPRSHIAVPGTLGAAVRRRKEGLRAPGIPFSAGTIQLGKPDRPVFWHWFWG